jgi:leucyl-tRNA synthetase
MTKQTYDFSQIEPRWQKYWQEIGLFTADEASSKPDFYILSMYPYPSGVLHIGHMFVYTISDALSRYYIMRGYNVLCPMGWDSFGLPAENAAIRAGIHPADSIRVNIQKMREQMWKAGFGFDWTREVATSHPGYYRWTQWLFLQFYKAGHAVRKKAAVNWCPSCSTVLANEQVMAGECERCGSQVEQRDLVQWFFTMSRDAQRLLDNHKKLTGWPEKVLKMQEYWIGRSEGARIDFTIGETGETLPVFTTRPDTLFGVTFMSIAPEHPLVEKLVQGTAREKSVMQAVAEMRRQGTAERERVEIEKLGIDTGFHVVNPANGERVPLWVTNFALMTYGTGAVMSVPAHDQRDYEFAKKYRLPIRVVIQPADRELKAESMTEAYEGAGVQVNSGPFDGIPNGEAMAKITEFLASRGRGDRTVSYRLRDWLLSRQRYWGAPIPIIHCSKCGEVPVPEKDLPVLLPREVDFRPTGESPLASCREFVETTCPRCSGPARRETDTMDTFVDSSWYFLRYLSPRDERRLVDPAKAARWMPVKQYVGGKEHATMHLIYARYFFHIMNDLGLVAVDEPTYNLFCQGVVCKEAHYCAKDKWLRDDQVEDGRCRVCGEPATSEMSKVSKTKLNIVDPDEFVNRFGADTVRFYMLSDSPAESDQVWNDAAVPGINRFLHRLWLTVGEIAEAHTGVKPFEGKPAGLSADDRELHRMVHKTVLRMTDAFEKDRHFNTGIALVHELVGLMRSDRKFSPPVLVEAAEMLVRILSPIIPHIAEEMWTLLGHPPSVFHVSWPQGDADAAADEVLEVAVQVNGKVRGRIAVPVGAENAAVERQALADPKVKEWTTGKTVRKVIVVPGRLVNIVAT